MFSAHLYVITGFGQRSDTRSRLIELWADLYRELPECVSVQLRPWRTDWAAEAEFILRMSDEIPRVIIIGYSWGAGWGFCQLSKHLSYRGIPVRRALLIDPVYKSPWSPIPWRSFCSWIPITIPENVDRVIWWRQRLNRPQGHRLIAAGPHTVIEDPVIVQATHANMDDQARITRRCRVECLQQLI